MAVTGPAASLLLALTRRLPLSAGAITIDGDASLAQHWVDHSAHVAG